MPDQQGVSLVEASVGAPPATRLPPQPQMLAELLGPRRGRVGDHRGFILRRILLLTDVVALLGAYAFAEVTVGFHSSGRRLLSHDALLLVVAIPAWIMFARAHDLYHVDSRRSDHSAVEELGPIVWMTTMWSWGILLLGWVSGLRTVSIPKLSVFWLATVALLLGLRSLARAWSRRQSWYQQRAIIVGTPQETAAVISKIRRHPEYGIQVAACVEPPPAEGAGGAAGGREVPVIHSDQDLSELIGELDIDRVILGASLNRDPNASQILSQLRSLHLHIDMVPSWQDVVGTRVDLHELEGMPLITVPNIELSRSSLLLKRLFDLAVATVGLLLLLPLLALCAIVIKLDSPGPVLFRQRRVGRDGRSFELIKFRSMRADAEARKGEVASLSFHGGGTQTGMFKIAGDPRITRVGRVLRRLSIDELPQLVNILRGEMSLVGPRPLIESEYRQIVGRHRVRATLTPGLTGLWQVNGRSDIPFEGMIDLDYLYVTNWSLWGDIKLLIRTFSVVARGRGAY